MQHDRPPARPSRDCPPRPIALSSPLRVPPAQADCPQRPQEFTLSPIGCTSGPHARLGLLSASDSAVPSWIAITVLTHRISNLFARLSLHFSAPCPIRPSFVVTGPRPTVDRRTHSIPNLPAPSRLAPAHARSGWPPVIDVGLALGPRPALLSACVLIRVSDNSPGRDAHSSPKQPRSTR